MSPEIGRGVLVAAAARRVRIMTAFILMVVLRADVGDCAIESEWFVVVDRVIWVDVC